MGIVIIKRALILSIVMFIIPFILGYIVGIYSPALNSKGDLVHIHPGWDLFLSVFINNIVICMILILGLFTFGIPTVYLLVANGFVLGIGISNLIAIEFGMNEFIGTLLPHVLLEIPAFILAGAIGLKGFSFYMKKEKRIPIKLFSLYGFSILITILIAAILEAYISASF